MTISLGGDAAVGGDAVIGGIKLDPIEKARIDACFASLTPQVDVIVGPADPPIRREPVEAHPTVVVGNGFTCSVTTAENGMDVEFTDATGNVVSTLALAAWSKYWAILKAGGK